MVAKIKALIVYIKSIFHTIINLQNDEARANLHFVIATGGKEAKAIVVEKLPPDWEGFPNTASSWVSIDLSKLGSNTSCLFHGKKGEMFPPHYHPNVEQYHIVNEGGKIISYTRTKTQKLEYPQGMCYSKEEVHAIKFVTETTLLVIWTPEFETKELELGFVKQE